MFDQRLIVWPRPKADEVRYHSKTKCVCSSSSCSEMQEQGSGKPWKGKREATVLGPIKHASAYVSDS